MLRRVNNLTEMREILSVTVLCAPDKFPQREFLQPEDQLTLVKAFEELEHGLQILEKQLKDSEKVKELRNLLDASLASYQRGDKIKGAHLLQDFEERVFGNR